MEVVRRAKLWGSGVGMRPELPVRSGGVAEGAKGPLAGGLVDGGREAVSLGVRRRCRSAAWPRRCRGNAWHLSAGHLRLQGAARARPSWPGGRAFKEVVCGGRGRASPARGGKPGLRALAPAGRLVGPRWRAD